MPAGSETSPIHTGLAPGSITAGHARSCRCRPDDNPARIRRLPPAAPASAAAEFRARCAFNQLLNLRDYRKYAKGLTVFCIAHYLASLSVMERLITSGTMPSIGAPSAQISLIMLELTYECSGSAIKYTVSISGASRLFTELI